MTCALWKHEVKVWWPGYDNLEYKFVLQAIETFGFGNKLSKVGISGTDHTV